MQFKSQAVAKPYFIAAIGLFVGQILFGLKFKTIAPQPETDNYLTLEASADSLRIQCFLPDGTRIDDASITK